MVTSKLSELYNLLAPPEEQFALEEIIANDQLERRPSRKADFKAEAEALVELSEALADSPNEILQKLSDIAIRLCRADSAGVSIAETENGSDIFRWRGVAGELKPFLLGTIPRDFSPCGHVFKTGSHQLMVKIIGHYHYVSQLGIPLYEVLLVPFSSGGNLVGTIWVVAHTRDKNFDSEDLRVLKSLSRFASAAYRSRTDAVGRRTTEAELAFERHKLEAIFQETPAAMTFCRGKDFVFEKVNPQYQEIFPDRVLVGKPFLEACPEFRGSPFVDCLNDVFITGKPFVGKEVHASLRTRKDGPLEDRYYDFTYLRIDDTDGKPYGVYDHAVDVTERVNARKELEFEQLKLKTVIENSTASIAILQGKAFTYELTNKSYAELFNNRQLIGKPLLEALPELANQEFPKHAKSVFETGVPYIDCEALAWLKRTEDGPLEERYFDQTYCRIPDQKGEPYGIFMHAQEVTDRVMARRELEIAKAAAEHANQTKSSFLANMSHEIRTPLGAILGFADLLREKNLDSTERAQFIDTISRSGKALTKIIDDILDLAKVESGKLEVEMIEFSLSDLVHEVMDLFRERTRSKNLYLRAQFAQDISPRVIADPTRLRQILINIIGNAVKFTNDGGVTVNIRHQPTSKNKVMLIISVQDTGVGLSSEQKEKLFQPFTQADNSTTRKFGGTGLGLNLSQRLAHALGGSIKIADGECGKGCIFTISISADVPTHKDHDSVSTKSESDIKGLEQDLPLEGLHILVAEDSEDNQFIVERMLAEYGAAVTIVDNGLIAFRNAIEGTFDLVLMDIQMPEMDGYEATRCLREAGFKKPIIALTAHAMAEERARTHAAGCDGHLTKPLDRSHLVEAVLLHTKKLCGADRSL